MKDTNCSIALSFFASSFGRSKFAYHMTRSSTGWSVAPDGSIAPPARSRIVGIELGYPVGSTITGFQIVAGGSDLPSESASPWFVAPDSGAVVLDPHPFPPPPDAKVTSLRFDFGGSVGLLSYRLAVDGVWDDPKVYTDPIE